MRTLQVKLTGTSYSIVVGRGLVEKLDRFLKRLEPARKVLVVTERRVASLHLARLEKSLRRGKVPYQVFFLEGGEGAKSAAELSRIYAVLARNRFERRDVLIAFGGGVVGDVAGFAAATYLRGIPFIQIGTTLLAQVDSSIGGKTGINLPEGKNLVGAFYQPGLVLSDVTLLRTLPRRELTASLAEVIKVGVIRDRGLFQYVERNLDSILAADLTALEHIVFSSARIKAGVVERDEKETRGERMILNYGHTFGHAFEAARNYRGLRHGEAVALGMAAAARLSRNRGWLRPADEVRQNQLIERTGLPTRLNRLRFNLGRVIRHMLLDKKIKGGKFRFVLPTALGRVRVADDVTLSEVKKTLRELGGKQVP